jgi:hypothetical protein
VRLPSGPAGRYLHRLGYGRGYHSGRAAILTQLDLLVRGELPELLTWVRDYGPGGAGLVAQPDEIWTHRESDATAMTSGGWFVVVPLWTSEESPSDLSAELEITPDGEARILDVHVL